MYHVVRYVFQIDPQKTFAMISQNTKRVTFEAAVDLAGSMATDHASDLMVTAPVQFRPGAFTFQSSATSLVMYRVEALQTLHDNKE